MLKADEARQITKKSLSPDAEIIQPYLENIEEKIKKAAQQGKREIHNPFSEMIRKHSLPLTTEIREAVRKAVEAEGYTWVKHPNPDPGSPTSHAYETVSW